MKFSALGSVVLFFLAAPFVALGQARPRPLVIGVLSYESGEATASDSISRSAERGLQLGFEEARRTARLFGRDVREKRIVIKRTDDAAKAARMMARTTMMSALIVTNPELLAAADAMAAAGNAVLVMRVVPSAAAMVCSRFTFAVYPELTALDSVRSRWIASAVYSGGAGKVTAAVRYSAELWHSGLERFGALELNDRFRSRWKTGMDGEAWAAWVAVKIVSEASLRIQSVEPFLLLDYITRSEFDGHKGWPLTFRAEDHVLRQPIYIVAADAPYKVRDELPRGPRSETQQASEILDVVLRPRAGASCSK